jgi:hypothetical protein
LRFRQNHLDHHFVVLQVKKHMVWESFLVTNLLPNLPLTQTSLLLFQILKKHRLLQKWVGFRYRSLFRQTLP